MTDDEQGKPVMAAEPAANAAPVANDGAVPHGTVPRDDEVASSNTGAGETAGEAVTFFEGGDGREEARTDIERSG